MCFTGISGTEQENATVGGNAGQVTAGMALLFAGVILALLVLFFGLLDGALGPVKNDALHRGKGFDKFIETGQFALRQRQLLTKGRLHRWLETMHPTMRLSPIQVKQQETG